MTATSTTIMFNFLPEWLNPFSFVVIVGLGIVLLFVAALSLRNPLIGKLGARNIPRRPTQTALIVGGLTLSTVIIVSALAIGDTLDYSIQRHAVIAYGEIDEIISPPLFTTLAGLGIGDGEDPFAAVAEDADGAEGDAAAASLLAGTDYELIRNILRQGLPGISNERYQQLQAQAADEALIDGVAPAIAFPTIIRNTRSGQGAPLGFIFAVDASYDQQFGLHNVEGEAVEMEALNPGVGNVFQSATDLFRMASQAAAAGLTLDLNVAAVAVAAAGSLASGDFSEAEANALLTELLGEDAPQVPAGSLAQLQELLGGASAGSTEAQNGDLEIGDLATGETPATQSPSPTLEALNLPDVKDLLGLLNLNTMRAEIDRVLGVAGLQLRQGDVYLNRLGAEQLDARTGDLLEIYLGPIPLPYRVAGIVEESGPLGALAPVVVMDLTEAQQLLSPIMPDRVNAVLVSNVGDSIGGDIEALRPILGNIGNRTWIMNLPLDDATAAELAAAVGDMTQLEVIDPLNKQSMASLSGVAGTLFSTVFSIFGIFSIMAGVLLGRNMLGEFFDLVNPGALTLPWLEIGGILLLAYVFSLLTTILPAIQASRIYPAEALRYE